MPTNVPVPVFGPNGFVAPDETAILAGVLADLNAAYQTTLDPDLTTVQGQWASSETAVIGDANAMFLWFCNQVDPAFSSGRMQDGIARIYFLSRNPAQPTVAQCVCTGLDGVVLPVGALALATDGNFYICQEQGTITNGTVTLPFACAKGGPIPCASGSVNRIANAVFGWDSINNPADGALGNVVENRANFELRRQQAVAANSMGSLPSVRGAVLAILNVLDAYVTENDENVAVQTGGVWLQPNSLYVCVLGGDPVAVAQAIWSRKAPGCGYNGNTTITVSDPSPLYAPPVPSYSVTFQTPEIVPIYVVVRMFSNPGMPSNALALVQAAVIAAFAGADGGTRARIGQTVLASRYYGPIVALGAWATGIVSILVGVCPAGNIQASIDGAVMTVTEVTAGGVAPGQLLQDAAGNLIPGTLVIAPISGTGQTGTYGVAPPQKVNSETMTVINLGNEVRLDIDQAPTVVAGNIFLVLQ